MAEPGPDRPCRPAASPRRRTPPVGTRWRDPIEFGANNSGRAVGGSTIHFQMVALRWRPEWFRLRSALGYGRDWPVSWQRMWDCYAEVEDALKIAGPTSRTASAPTQPAARSDLRAAGGAPDSRVRCRR